MYELTIILISSLHLQHYVPFLFTWMVTFSGSYNHLSESICTCLWRARIWCSLFLWGTSAATYMVIELLPCSYPIFISIIDYFTLSSIIHLFIPCRTWPLQFLSTSVGIFCFPLIIVSHINSSKYINKPWRTPLLFLMFACFHGD